MKVLDKEEKQEYDWLMEQVKIYKLEDIWNMKPPKGFDKA